MGKTFFERECYVDGILKVSGGGQPTLASAISEGIWDALYYKNNYPDSVVIFNILEYCEKCGHSGTIPAKGLYKTKRCPECKGKVPAFKIENITLAIPNNIKLSEA